MAKGTGRVHGSVGTKSVTKMMDKRGSESTLKGGNQTDATTVQSNIYWRIYFQGTELRG